MSRRDWADVWGFRRAAVTVIRLPHLPLTLVSGTMPVRAARRAARILCAMTAKIRPKE